jgi:5-methylcytosine-specific restriction enzyme A
MSEDWSDEELEIAVGRYWKAIKQKGAEREVDRGALVKGALKAGLSARGAGSVSQRMCNISAVLEAHGKPWVLGWKPLRNVGSGVTPRIEALLRKHGLL